MKKNLFIAALALLAGPLLAADSTPKDDLTAAAKALADKPNYSWRTTVVVPDDSPFKPGPTDGKAEKDGYTTIKMSFGDNNTDVVKKGEKAAIKNADQDWQSLSELENSEGFGRFFAGMIRNLKTPAAEAEDLIKGTKEIKLDGDVYSGDLTEAGAKEKLTFRGGGDVTVTNPKGSVKFWVKDGVLTKYEFKVKGSVSFNDNNMDVDRTTTTEVKDVGATTVTVADEAKKKL
jgi:hypothetical protein